MYRGRGARCGRSFEIPDVDAKVVADFVEALGEKASGGVEGDGVAGALVLHRKGDPGAFVGTFPHTNDDCFAAALADRDGGLGSLVGGRVDGVGGRVT